MSKTFEQALRLLPDGTGEGGKVLAQKVTEDGIEYIEGEKDDILLWSGADSSGTETITSGYTFDDFKYLLVKGGASSDAENTTWVTIPISDWDEEEYVSVYNSDYGFYNVAVKKASTTTFQITSEGSMSILKMIGVY